MITEQITETASFFDTSVVGYVVMPSHVHMLIGMPDMSLLSKCIQSFKSITARRLLGALKESSSTLSCSSRPHKLWKRRFDDVIITSELQFRRKLQYIHDNPVKAGFVKESIDWEYSSARSWILGEPGLITIDRKYGWLYV
ncbi:MAG: transposase [candidate division Zixibacteria bacterium]|nr:transposase [candidate division Zixibacteria bacterium]